MRKVSYALILLTGLIFLIILVLTIAWATFDDEDYRRLAVRSVEAFTGYAMAIDGAFSLDLSTRPILSAEGIRLEARDGDPPPSLSKIGKFYVQLDLPQLIFGHLVVPELQAEDVVLAIAVPIGVTVGLVAGYLGGWTEYILMRITDVFLSIPPLVLAMSIMGVKPRSAALASVVPRATGPRSIPPARRRCVPSLFIQVILRDR